MHRRIVVAVATLLFSLLAIVVNVLTDLHDRTFPEALDTSSTLSLDFSQTRLSDKDAFKELAALSDRWKLGLVKVLPELSGDQNRQVFVPLGSSRNLPDPVRWYGDQAEGRVAHSGSLEHSFATGTYLVTGDPTHLDEFQGALTAQGIRVRREDDSLLQGLGLVVSQGAFRTTLMASAVLMVSLALYWLMVKARGRALRVLGGVAVWRIQLEDFGKFLPAMLIGTVPVTAVALSYVALTRGALYVPYFAQTLFWLGFIVVAITMCVAIAMSLTSWPSAAVLAARREAVQSLHKASTILKAATFVFLISSVGPVWIAYTDAKSVAAQQAQWKTLADQVVLRYPAAIGEAGFQALMKDVGGVVRSAEERSDVAMSYTLTAAQVRGADFGRFDALALANQRWLDLMLKEAAPGAVEAIRVDQVPPGIADYLNANLPIWTHAVSVGTSLSDFEIYQSNGSVDIALAAGGNGELTFPERPLILVAPSISATFNDDFIASLTSSNNIVFAGLEPTMRLLTERNLQHTIQVKYAAEDGVLRAQLTAYLAWLRGASFVGLLAAFAVAAGISAFINASLRARRDFPLRLAGKSWTQILAPLLTREWLVGLALTGLMALIEPANSLSIMLLCALAGLMVLTLAQFVGSRWYFGNISVRRF